MGRTRRRGPPVARRPLRSAGGGTCYRHTNRWNRGRWHRREEDIVELGRARCLFFSADPRSNVVGATAGLLLEGDEAQDVRPDKWLQDSRPMGASTNVTTVLWGIAWTSDTLLAQTIRHLQWLQAPDGRRRDFEYDADRVGAEVSAYAAYVAGEVQASVSRWGQDDFNRRLLEEIDTTGGLFLPLRRALMWGCHERRHASVPGRRHTLLVDVAGEDEAEGDATSRLLLANRKRDATALTVVDVAAYYGQLPGYRAVDRQLWLGVKHAALHGKILALAHHWHAMLVVVDATGVGAGLASFLEKALRDRLIAVQFSPKVESKPG